MLALMAPVFCIFFIAVDHAHRIPLRACLTRYARAVVLFSLGLSFYFFIFIRAHYDPVINWGHPDTLARFLVHVSRRAYQDVQLDFWNGITSLKKIIYFHFFLRDLYRQLTVVGALFSCIGFITLWFKKRTWFWLTLGMLLSNSILIIFLRSIRYTNELETIYTVYYLPSIIVAFLWFSIGVYATLLSIQRVTHRRVIILLFLLLLCILPGASFISNFHHNNRITMWLAHDWAASVLQSLEPDAILIMHNEQPASDSQIFSLAYLQLIERVRPDVAIVDFAYISSRWFHPIGTDVDEINRLPLRLMRARLLNRVWGIARDTHRPVYTLWPVGNDLNGDLTGVPNGLVYRIYPNIEYARGARITPASISLRNTDMDIFSDHPYYLDFLSEIYYARAAYLLTQSHAKASEEMLIKAYALDQTPLGASTQDLITWRERWLRKDE